MDASFSAIYSKPKIGKTTDIIYAFPDALFVAAPGALNSAVSVVGIEPRLVIDVGTIQEVTALLQRYGKKVRAIVVDDFSVIADETIRRTEKKKNGWKFWANMRNLLLDLRSAARDAGCHIVFNCLGGDTEVLTRGGFRKIRDLKGAVDVLSLTERARQGERTWKALPSGSWRRAEFRAFGPQRLYRVTFSDGTSIEATGDHLWYTLEQEEPVETANLRGHYVPIVLPPKPDHRGEHFSQGVLHGFTYGDGSRGPRARHAEVRIFTEAKATAMIPRFQVGGFAIQRPSYCIARISGLPPQWADELPPDDAAREYWFGFLLGLLAADGTVDAHGGVILYQRDADVLEAVRLKALECGFSCTPLFLQRALSPFTGEEAPCWRFSLRRVTVDPGELLLTHHRANFIEAGVPSAGRTFQAVSIEDTGRFEEVFCCVEPETHTFVITNGFLTGQCHERPSGVAKNGAARLGGPKLPGQMPEDFPALADLVLRVQYDSSRIGWPYAYTAGPDANWIVGDRYDVVKSAAPMNLGEILRAAGHDIPRPKGLEWIEPGVEGLSAVLASLEVVEERAVVKAAAERLSTAQRDPRHVAWLLRDAVDRAALRRRRDIRYVLGPWLNPAAPGIGNGLGIGNNGIGQGATAAHQLTDGEQAAAAEDEVEDE